jgi:hypothetical protein
MIFIIYTIQLITTVFALVEYQKLYKFRNKNNYGTSNQI